MPRVVVTTSSFAPPEASAHRRLLEAGLEVGTNPYGRKPTEEEHAALLRGAVGVIAGTGPLTAAVFDAAPSLRVISRCGVGVDNVDREAARARGIALYTTPDAPALAVAELTMGLLFDLLRRISEADRWVRAGRWQALMGRLLTGKTVGIVGLGRVGRRLAAFLQPFGVRLLAADPHPPPPDVLDRLGVDLVDLDALCEAADVVTLHVPALPETHHLFDAARLAGMKPGALLINAARGGLVDEEALVEVLRDGRLSGAALDTFAREPYDGPLTDLPNVVLTAHMGSYAVESRERMEEEAVDNLLDGLRACGAL